MLGAARGQGSLAPLREEHRQLEPPGGRQRGCRPVGLCLQQLVGTVKERLDVDRGVEEVVHPVADRLDDTLQLELRAKQQDGLVGVGLAKSLYERERGVGLLAGIVQHEVELFGGEGGEKVLVRGKLVSVNTMGSNNMCARDERTRC